MLKFTAVALRRAATLLFEDATFVVHPGQKLGLTGANGTGKSSLFSLIQGRLEADLGDFSKPDGWVTAEVLQETALTEQVAIEYVIDGDSELRQVQTRLAQAEKENHSDQIAACHVRLEEISGYQAESRAARLLAGLGFSQAEVKQPLRTFSGGWIMRLGLARALMCRSDLLLLDEPTNHLDLDAVIWLEQWLKHYQGTLLLISHDRDFLDNVADHITHIEHGKVALYRGNYSAFEEQRAERLAQQQAGYVKQQQSIAHMQSFIDRFKAKATKARQAQSRIKALERMQKIGPAHIDSPFHFKFKPAKSLPSSLVRIDKASVGYGDITILDKIEFSLIPGERIGLLGLNGAGKSTFIKLLADELEAHSGQIIRAKELQVGYFAQHQVEQLDSEATALLTLQRLDPSLSEREVRSYLGGFNFSNDKVLQKVASFSGGEKARLVLALLIWKQPNLILLDEPTNHLDLEMRLALNEALQDFEGSVILVSHDRHLLRSVCDDLWLVDRGEIHRFDQDIDYYPRWLAERKSNKPTGEEKLPANGERKQKKKLSADFRKQIQPQMTRIKRLETRIGRLANELKSFDTTLSDTGLYNGDKKSELANILQDQAYCRMQLDETEEEWMILSEEVEALTAAES
jgi:ATP-binding cassette, subfamily F, member 3